MSGGFVDQVEVVEDQDGAGRGDRRQFAEEDVEDGLARWAAQAGLA